MGFIFPVRTHYNPRMRPRRSDAVRNGDANRGVCPVFCGRLDPADRIVDRRRSVDGSTEAQEIADHAEFGQLGPLRWSTPDRHARTSLSEPSSSRPARRTSRSDEQDAETEREN
jgi:hypothetical protein